MLRISELGRSGRLFVTAALLAIAALAAGAPAQAKSLLTTTRHRIRSRSFRFAFLFTLVLLPVLGISAAAQAVPSRTVTITPTSGAQSWTGDTATGANAQYNFSAGEPCTDTDGVPPADPEYCDLTLLHVNVPSDFWVSQTGGVEVRLDNYSPNPSSDFDLQVFASDASGTKGSLVASSGGPASAHERATVKEPSGFYLIHVVYFAVTSSSYDGHVEFFFRDRAPADVDMPPGLQEYLASDPSQGWTSRSEPHIAQSPVDPKVLVAGSKFYNKDPDALGEYEFKIGTYVSFDGGVSWSDLGQLKACPASQAPPSSWPNNMCYPADDPTAQGTGLEDAATGGPGATVNEAVTLPQVTPGEDLLGTEFSNSRPLVEGPVGPVPVFFANDEYGCEWTTAVASGIPEWIGLARRGAMGVDTCPAFQNKFNTAAAAGADGLIVINFEETSVVGTAAAQIPGIMVNLSDGNRLKSSLDSTHPQQVKVTLQLGVDGPGATVNEAVTLLQVTPGEHIVGTEFDMSRPLSEGSVGPVPVFFANDEYGCQWTTAVASGIPEWIGLARRGPMGVDTCPAFQNKFNTATAAGADGLIVINFEETSVVGTAAAQIPGIMVTLSDGNRLKNSLDATLPQQVKVTLQFPRGPDFGEEYITSDVWTQFDDEGNAYAMVLDAPPFTSGVGWGMTLHRWESVSAQDLVTGNTWSDRIRINAYPASFPRDFLGFLDDKNTFAVNNAGPDGDGITGTMIACWGQNVSTAIKQQIVCERSIDGGITWPDEPVPVSGVHQLVIGVHVIADEFDPNVFYAVWLQYETTLAPNAPATVEVAKTINGGVSWLPAVEVDVIDDIPRTFPRQGFRNLSIPIMAVGPDPDGAGTGAPPLYIVVAEYLAAPVPANDEDGMQADIIRFKSTDGGATWSRQNITNATGPGTNRNADQFQPYIDVTASGQLNVTYFDRRLDLKTATHPGNYFTDVFLSRSNDGGTTWTDTRLTHDATDPEFNAPVSGSGLFFGDYQGLVADECNAIPFVNDTHLANDEFLDPGPVRDPDFDQGLPSSPYQQSIAWRVPNTTAFGGTRSAPCGPTAVSIRGFAARWNGSRVVVSWTTASEVDALGFNVWRSRNANATKVNRVLILAKRAGVAGATHRLVDRTARAGVSYTYRLQAVRRDGSRSWLGRATVRTKR